MFEQIKDKYENLQEIRVRCGKNIIVKANNAEYLENTVVDKEYIENLLSYFTSDSMYAFKQEISEGFVTVKGGNRVGICGKCVMKNGLVEHIKEISSVNIRFAREFIGCADLVFDMIKGNLKNTVFVSPPGCGKTTMLRDISRSLSYYGNNVCIVDERGEIAPFSEGVSIFDLGPRCDVMSGVPKYIGVNMVLRTMNPDVIVVDEIGKEKEIDVIRDALNSGIKIITSFHAGDKSEFERRFPASEIFECVVVLSKKNGVGEIKKIIC